MDRAAIQSPEALRALLEWQIAMGADEAIDTVALDRLAMSPPALPPAITTQVRPRPSLQPQPVHGSVRAAIVAPPGALAESLAEAAQSARLLAASAESIE